MDMIDLKWMVPPQCIPVHANVTTFDWKPMYEHTKFDVILVLMAVSCRESNRDIVGMFDLPVAVYRRTFRFQSCKKTASCSFG